MPVSTNNGGTSISDRVRRLSLSTAAATPLPIYPMVLQSGAQGASYQATSPFAQVQMPRSPLRRTPSSGSIGSNARSTTPTLHKRTSLSSLKGVEQATPPRPPSFRRTSSNLAASPTTAMGARPVLSTPAEEPPQPTAASVAKQIFLKELEIHHNESDIQKKQETVVILQDDCYGHRYSRPRTSRLGLSTIVERPERIHASILGLATAYVRLGGRHAEGHAAPHAKDLKSPPSIPFRIHKTNRTLSLTSQAATAVHGTQWMKELRIMCEGAEAKLALNGKELTRPGAAEQASGNVIVDKPKLHEGDLYLCSGSLNALEGALGGVCEGVDAVFADDSVKRAFVCIRPPGHHCSVDYPSGFCWLNNVHVGIGHAAITHGLTHAAIIDFDLHHGDGSQSITWAHNSRMGSLPKNTPISKKTAIGYFSLHDINSYPCEMGDEEKVRNASLCLENSHGQTMWNVHLQPWKTDAEFWELYENRYSVIIAKARSFLRHHADRLRQAPTHPQPRAAIFLSAGFDASEWESPGMQRHQVNVPTDFYARFTRDVVKMSEEEGLGVNGRVISVLEGGYSDRALMSGILSHLSGLTTITNDTGRPAGTSNGLGREMSQRLGKLDMNGSLVEDATGVTSNVVETFDPSWWILPRLEEIEKLVKPPPVVTAPRKVRNATPTYISATQSYTAKIVSPQNRRSLSGSGTNNHMLPSLNSRAPTPPPPEVDWATAAHELWKLLIPSNRQTESCKPEDLSAQATRVRKDRQSTIGLPAEIPASDGKRMQLRERTSKPPKYLSEDEEEKPQARANRRKTIADVSILGQSKQDTPPTMAHVGPEKVTKQTSRRVSVASSIGSVCDERPSDLSLGSSADNQLGRDPLLIKKNRIPNANTSDVPKARAVRKLPPVPRVPSAYSATSKIGDLSASNLPKYEENQAPLSVNEDLRNKDVEHLASGMKKMNLKLNMKPKQEQKAGDAKLKPAARGRPKSTALNTSKARSTARTEKYMPLNATAPAVIPSSELDVSPQAPVEANPGIIEHQLIQPQPLSANPLPTASDMVSEMPLQFPSNPKLTADSTPSTVSEALQELSPSPKPYQQPSSHEVTGNRPMSFLAPSAPTIPAPMPQIRQDDMHTLAAPSLDTGFDTMPTATSAPPPGPPAVMAPPSTPKRTKHHLPIFTSSSPIMFANPSAITSTINPTVDPNSIYEAEGPVSDLFPNIGSDSTQYFPLSTESTSERSDSRRYVHSSNTSVQSDPAQYIPQGIPVAPVGGCIKLEQPSVDIWDIPGTPQHRRN